MNKNSNLKISRRIFDDCTIINNKNNKNSNNLESGFGLIGGKNGIVLGNNNNKINYENFKSLASKLKSQNNNLDRIRN